MSLDPEVSTYQAECGLPLPRGGSPFNAQQREALLSAALSEFSAGPESGGVDGIAAKLRSARARILELTALG
ncbi:MAG: hypothetical protein GF320_17025, partial [Armatimonadia bacterium]|nr:hypothetical protein [Armatimonadia bacterium]